MLAGIKHLGCLAHLRHKFDEVLKAPKNPTGRAKEALDMIGKAISYALGQRIFSHRDIDDGRYAIDNNLIERDICLFATVGKAWLSSSSVPGADASAVTYSRMLTCRACDVEPHAWLCHMRTALPKRQPGEDVTDLLPFNYAKR